MLAKWREVPLLSVTPAGLLTRNGGIVASPFSHSLTDI